LLAAVGFLKPLQGIVVSLSTLSNNPHFEKPLNKELSDLYANFKDRKQFHQPRNYKL